MSVVFYGFLGRDTQDLENRFLQEFACIGFEVVIHPQMKLLEANGGHLSLAFVKTPPNLKRLHPDTPLLTDFEYSVSGVHLHSLRRGVGRLGGLGATHTKFAPEPHQIDQLLATLLRHSQ
jgi:hypothetical protein